MLVRRSIGVLFLLALAAVVALAPSSCGKSSSGASIASNCSINSDCDSPLVCAFGRCHSECAESRDCPSGQRCISSTAGGVCQLAQESTCNTGTLCQSNQVCGSDQQCRLECTSMGGCIAGDYCLTAGGPGACYSASNPDDQPALILAGILAPDGAVLSDASVVMVDGSVGPTPDGSSGGGPDGGAPDAGNESSVAVNSCPSAQTQFGSTAQGDTNPNFVSGVGVRGPNALLIFDSYNGPDPVGDGGTTNYIYVQAFDPVTSNSRGAAQPLVAVDTTDVNPVTIQAAAIAPTGQIVLLYSNPNLGLSATFLGESADGGAGPAGLQIVRTVALDVNTLSSQPAAIWSVAAGAFVFSWQYGGTNGYVKIQKFLPDGQSAGAGTDQLPTTISSANTGATGNGYVAASGSLYGVPYRNYGGGTGYMTVLDSLGNEIGDTFVFAPSIGNWTTAAGTPGGFVTLYDLSGIGETFVPVSPDGGVAAAQTDGGLDAALPGFHFSGAKSAANARAINDDVGGKSGVGVAILFSDGVAFAYVNADGLTHVGPTDLFAHTLANPDYINITNYGGSFGVSLYTSATHATQMAASGCASP